MVFGLGMAAIFGFAVVAAFVGSLLSLGDGFSGYGALYH